MTINRHDFRKYTWGHGIRLDGREDNEAEDWTIYRRCHGFSSPRVKDGDECLLAFGRGTVVGRLTRVENKRDPRDMFFCEVEFLGYLDEKTGEIVREPPSAEVG